MKPNTAAAADVLRCPDKTVQLVLKKKKKKKSRFVLCLFSLSPSSPSCLCLSSNDPSSFSPCKRVYSSIWTQPNSIVEGFCLRQSHRRAVVECGAHGPGQIELNALPGLWRDAAAVERNRQCVNSCSLATPSYLKVLISALFHSPAINWDTTDAFCILRHNKTIFIVLDSSFFFFF